jgi:hypothetical protein
MCHPLTLSMCQILVHAHLAYMASDVIGTLGVWDNFGSLGDVGHGII